MKVVFDISVLGHGHENLLSRTGVFRVIENLAENLVASDECSLTFSSIYNALASGDYLKTNPRLSPTPFPRAALSPRLERIVERANARVAATRGSKRLWWKSNRRLVVELYETIAKHSRKTEAGRIDRADIFHSPFYPFPQELNNVARVKYVITVYDLIAVLYPQYFEKFANRDVIQQVVERVEQGAYAVCISQATKNDLCNYSKAIDPNRVSVAHLAASDLFYPCRDDEQTARVRRKYGIPNAPYVLSLSTLEPRKNLAHTIRSFARVVREHRIADLNLVLAGSKGWKYEDIFEAIDADAKLRERIILTGFVDDADLAPLYSDALAFVYPSLYEGFGLPPLEAMQCGVPVITSNTSSLPEVVGDAGIMLDPKDEDALCQSFLDIYEKPELRAAMSAKSAARAKSFTWQKCAGRTIDAYRAALGS